jgi:hypothetical protein
MGSEFVDIPCGSNCDVECEIRNKMIELQETLVSPPANKAADVKFGKSTDRQGDVDIVIYDQEMVALVEIKSSPLSVYPLEIKLARPMTEVRDGASVPKRDHSPATADIDRAKLSFYAPHIDFRIPLGRTSESNWPYPALIRFVSEPQKTRRVWIEATTSRRERTRYSSSERITKRNARAVSFALCSFPTSCHCMGLTATSPKCKT